MTPSDTPPPPEATGAERLKRSAAEAALALVDSGMLVGLGSGSTAAHATRGIAARIAAGALTRIRAVPTSEATRSLAASLAIPLVELPEGGVDVAIDGMDEVDPRLDAIKGLGGALLREKIVAASAATFALIGDGSKRVPRLGTRSAVPVEVLPFGHAHTLARLRDLGLAPTLRAARDAPFRTDNGHWIADCAFDAQRDPSALAQALEAVPGVLAHGFFLGLAQTAYVATEDGVHALRRAGA